jgi:hypothetical protein
MNDSTKTPALKLTSVRVHPSDNERLKTIKDAQNFTGTFPDFMTAFLNQTSGVELFKDKDRVKLEIAAEKLGITVESLIIQGALKFAAKTMATDLDKKETSVDAKIQAFVDDLMAQNEKAGEWFKKHEITQAYIVNGFKKATGKEVNRANVTAFMAANVSELEAHHTACGIEKDHNRKVFNHERKNKKA